MRLSGGSTLKRVVRSRRRRGQKATPDDPYEEYLATGVLTMGRFSYGRPTISRFAGDTAKVNIGSFVSIAPDVEFIPGGMHRVDWVSTFPFRYAFDLPGSLTDGHPASRGDIVVGHDVWIATGARILSGVTIGNGAVIGAGAQVASDVRPYAIVVGNPAREVRRRFSDERVDALEEIAWWDWPTEQIREAVDLLCSEDVDALIRRGAAISGERSPGAASGVSQRTT